MQDFQEKLKIVNSIDALASFSKNYIDKAHYKTNVKLANLDEYNGHNVIVLFWNERTLRFEN